MPRKDRIHEAVKNALIKDGWTITDDPFRIHYEDADVYADLRVRSRVFSTPPLFIIWEQQSAKLSLIGLC
jgi:hypothetical protein